MREMILFSSQRIFFGIFLGLVCAWFSPSLAQISVSGWTKPAAPKAEATPSLTKLAERKEAPQIHRATNLKLESIKKYSLPAPTAQEMEQREKSRKLKIGITRNLPQVLDVVAQSSTVAVTEGEVKSLRIASEGAVQLRLHLNRLEIPADASVFVYAANNPKEFYGPYRTGSAPLWTPPISGSEAVIEIFIPTGKEAAKAVSVRLEIDQISHIFRYPKSANISTQQAQAEDAESCNEDVTTEWSETAKSVAMVQFHQPDGEYVCSGVLLNDTKNSGTPYFLTANHCIDNAVTANSTRFYWFFDTANSNPDSNVTYSAEMLQTSDVSDFTLLRIKNPVPAGVRFSGWTTTLPTANTTVTSIHHPAADYKRISFGRIVTNTCPSYLPPEFCDNFHAVRWNAGITEPGSSGGGLWVGSASDPKLIGQLLGGESDCLAPNGLDSYGRFDITMEAVARHLTGQGCQYSLSHKKQIVESGGGAAKVQVFVNDMSDCSWMARSNVNWITVQNTQGQGDATVNFTVAPNTSGAKRSGLIFVAGHILRIIQRGAAETCAETPKLALGATVNGTLSASNCLSVTGYGAAAVRYTFDTQPGQFFSIAVQATEFDPYVTLIGPDGRVIRENDDIGYNNTNARIPNAYYNNQIGGPLTGTYTIEVSTTDPTKSGNFTLVLEKGCSYKAVGKYTRYSAYGVPLGTTDYDRRLQIEVEVEGNCSLQNLSTSLISNTNWLGRDYDPSSTYLYADLATGKGIARYEMPTNSGANGRRSLIDLAGHQILIEQAAFCNSINQPTVTPTTATYDGRMQSSSLQIKMQPGAFCTWEWNRGVTNYPDWIVMEGGFGDQSSDTTLKYRVNDNRTENSRTGAIKISDQLHTVTQTPFDLVCPPTFIAFNQTVTGSLEASDCQTNIGNRQMAIDRYTVRGYAKQQVAFAMEWGAEITAFTIYSPKGKVVYQSGLGFGKGLRAPTTGYYDLPEDGIYTVEIQTAAPPVNPSASYSFTAEAFGGPNCVYTMDTAARVAKVAGDNFLINFSGTASCPWTASSDANWISFPEGATGTGSKTINVQVAANTGPPRETVVRIAGRAFTIIQDAPCSYVGFLDEKGAPKDAFYTFWGLGGGGFRALSVVTGNNCTLTAKSNSSWITILNTVGKNVFMTIGENPGAIRRGEIEVSGVKIPIVQGSGNLGVVSGADYSNRIARQGILSIFGEELAANTESAKDLPLPLHLSDVDYVRLFNHASGSNDYVSLFYVSPTQINVLLPEHLLYEGPTRIEVYRKNGLISRGEFVLSRVAPAIFSADASGTGLAAAEIQRITASGESKYEKVTEIDGTGKIIARSIDLGPDSERVFLLLYGIGTRMRSDVKNVSCEIDGQSYPVDYAGAQGYFAGVDQINVLLPKALRGKGEVTVRLKVDDQFSNAVKIKIAP